LFVVIAVDVDVGTKAELLPIFEDIRCELFFDALAAALLAAPANDEVFVLLVLLLLVLLVAPNPLIGKLEEDVVGGDLLVVSTEEVEANKFVLVELIESPAGADEVLALPPKLNPPLSDGLLAAVLEGLELIAAPPNPAKGNEGASVLSLFVNVAPLKPLFGNKDLLPPPDEGNDAPKDEPNILISNIIYNIK